jgi:hypothetical protein
MTTPQSCGPGPAGGPNPLRDYFDGVAEGPGVWKWRHYFAAYHRHLARFVGRAATVVEVGVGAGGSLRMWRHYFGPTCRVHGIDVREACRAAEGEGITVHVGDQADRAFWRDFRARVPEVDVLIDDGGHLPQQQRVTYEEMLPHLRPGGVYLCEDVHGAANPFSRFVHGAADGLNAFARLPGEELASAVTPLQAAVHSIHFYPYLVVVERSAAPPERLSAPKRGTDWPP